MNGSKFTQRLADLMAGGPQRRQRKARDVLKRLRAYRATLVLERDLRGRDNREEALNLALKWLDEQVPEAKSSRCVGAR